MIKFWRGLGGNNFLPLWLGYKIFDDKIFHIKNYLIGPLLDYYKRFRLLHKFLEINTFTKNASGMRSGL